MNASRCTIAQSRNDNHGENVLQINGRDAFKIRKYLMKIEGETRLCPIIEFPRLIGETKVGNKSA